MEANSEATVEWLRAWSLGPWTVSMVDPSQKNPKFPALHFDESTIDKLRLWLNKYNGTHNLYFMINTPSPSVTTTPDIQTRNEIIAINCLHVDIDLPKNQEHTQSNLEPLLRRLQAFDPAPTAIVFSGGGYQAFWLFQEPLPAQQYLEQISQINAKIATSAKADHCWNINRWMRLPGTMNLPNASKLARGRQPMLAQVVEADWSRKWSLAHPIPKLPADFFLDEDQDPQDQYILSNLPVKLQKAIKTGDSSEYGNDDSRLVLYIITQLVRLGWPDDKILPFLTEEQYPSSKHCRSKGNAHRTAQRQIDRAREKVATDWERNNRGAIMRDSPKNIRRALNEIGAKFYRNAFSGRNYVNGYGPTRVIDDDIESLLSLKIYDEFNFLPIDKILSTVITDLAYKNIRHPVREYLDTLQWDQTPRIDTWLHTYGQAEDNEYTRAVSRLILIAACRRVRKPGCKFDEMLVLVDPTQGTDKSSVIATLAVNEDWFSDSLPLNADDKKTIEQISGRWILEISELTGIKHSDVENLKAFLSRQVDRARLAYGHHATDAPRQCIFIGTTNSETFLRDVSNRRFWPVNVRRFDTEALRRDRDQLWAEAAVAEAAGESIRLHPSLWSLAAVHQEKARHEDPWVSTLDEFLVGWKGRITTNNVWKILGKPVYQRTALDSHHLTEAMREIGWERAVRTIDGKSQRCFLKGTKDEHRQTVHVWRDLTGEVVISHTPQKERQPGEDEEIPF